jgi:hypothetical protein
MITERLQEAIRSSGVTRYAIWKRTGIGQDTLCHFMKNETGLALSTVDKILDCLGLEIVIQPKRTSQHVRARREK